MPVLSTLGAAIANVYGFTSGLIKDQYFNLVSLLLPGNGTNGAQNNTFLDGSSNNFTITRNGNTTQGTFSPFSQTGWGNRFDGSANYRLTIPDSTDLDIAGDFCLELWVYFLSQSASNQLICIGNENSAQNGFILYNSSSTPSEISLYTNGSTAITTSSAGVTTNRWHHIALVRNGSGAGNTVIYVDGVSRGSAQITTSFTGLAGNGLSIGQTYNGSYVGVLNAYLSNVRLVNGSPVYTGAFTPPTTPLTAITNTKLLTCQSNRFVDANTQVAAKTITVTGSPSVTPFSPFAPTAAYTTAAVGGSGYFDGTGDYLTAPNNTALDLSTGDFTIECWFYPTSFAALSPLVYRYNGNYSTGADFQFGIAVTTTGSVTVRPYQGTTDYTLTAGTAVLNTWNHIAFVRTGNTFWGFVNGNRSASSQTVTGALNNSTWATTIGAILSTVGGNNFATGYIADTRILKGTALYTTSTYTVPTTPLTAITNTSLLLNFTNAGITDATAKNVLETVGNAQISTTQSKWGGGSIYLDGTSNTYVRGPVQIYLGSSNFTIEGWVRFNSIPGAEFDIYKIQDKNDGSSFGALRLILNSSMKLKFLASTTGSSWGISVDNLGNTLSTGVWYYIAITRSGSDFKVYVNGSQAGATQTLSGALYAGPINALGWNGVTTYSNMYFDDVRLTVGLVRDVTTSPIAPFPVQ